MNKEIEICVKCYDSLEELNKKLKLNKFVVKEDFILKDIYMSNELKEIKNKNYPNLLSDYLLIRETVGKRKTIVHKCKKYDGNGGIINQKNSKCGILDIKNAYDLLLSIGYREFLRLEDHNILVSNNKNELYIQVLSSGDIYIEMESRQIYSPIKNGENIQELINSLKQYNFNIGDFFFENKAINTLKTDEKL